MSRLVIAPLEFRRDREVLDETWSGSSGLGSGRCRSNPDEGERPDQSLATLRDAAQGASMTDRCWLTAMLARLSRDSSWPDPATVPFGPLLALGRIRSSIDARAQPSRSIPQIGAVTA
jgi:hypothetical protein